MTVVEASQLSRIVISKSLAVAILSQSLHILVAVAKDSFKYRISPFGIKAFIKV